MKNNRSRCFVCTGTKTVDVTMKAKRGELVMVDLVALNNIYIQGFMDGMSDTVGEPLFASVYTVEAEDGHA